MSPTSPLFFRGLVLAGGRPHVLMRHGAGAEQPLPPVAPKKFDWGSMSDNVGHLAESIAAQLYPPAERQAVATIIKSHFLTAIKRNAEWELSSTEIRAYVDAKRAGVPA